MKFNDMLKAGIQGVIRQGRPSHDEENTCMYRGPDGAKCAVGHMIPDRHYHPDLENKVVEQRELVGVLCWVMGREITSEEISQLGTLQKCHDYIQHPHDLSNFSEKFANSVREAVKEKSLPEVCLDYLNVE